MAFEDLIIVNKNNNVIDKASSSFNNYINNNSINYNYNYSNINKVFVNDNNKYIFNEKKYYNNMIINEFFLPPIKSYYQYTLVLDLDETLIYFQKDNNFIDYTNDNYNSNKKNTLIFRPGLLDFLRKMKPLYELVLFSFGTKEYVNHILTIIEKKEKFFEYVLYRQHATFEKGDYVKNLALLGRDLKKIIIVDNIPHVFKLQKSNGICIKSFYGDVISERNTLKILGKILETIRFDAEENDGDIRKSLKKQRNLIFTYITTNLE
jgi:Dullard-like phosphatase family protein